MLTTKYNKYIFISRGDFTSPYIVFSTGSGCDGEKTGAVQHSGAPTIDIVQQREAGRL